MAPPRRTAGPTAPPPPSPHRCRHRVAPVGAPRGGAQPPLLGAAPACAGPAAPPCPHAGRPLGGGPPRPPLPLVPRWRGDLLRPGRAAGPTAPPPPSPHRCRHRVAPVGAPRGGAQPPLLGAAPACAGPAAPPCPHAGRPLGGGPPRPPLPLVPRWRGDLLRPGRAAGPTAPPPPSPHRCRHRGRGRRCRAWRAGPSWHTAG